MKEIENIFPCSYRVIETRRPTCGSLGETRNCVEVLALRAPVPTQILVSPKLPRVLL